MNSELPLGLHQDETMLGLSVEKCSTRNPIPILPWLTFKCKLCDSKTNS